MWPFASRGARYGDDPTVKLSSRIALESFRTNDGYIKLWLPEKIVAAVDVLCKAHNASRPDILRWVLFEHLYGRVEFEFLRQSVKPPPPVPDIQLSPKEDSGIRFSTARHVNIEYLGKATEDLKLWLPSMMKSDLESASQKSGSFFSNLVSRGKVPISDYIRAVLVRHLFGEKFFVEWQYALATASQTAVRREAG